MRTVKAFLVAALVAGVLTAAGVRAETAAAGGPAAASGPAAAGSPAAASGPAVASGPTAASPGAMVYIEAQKDEVDALLPMVATMPVMKLFMPQMQSRFVLIEQVLHLAPGSFDAAAPHLARIAFVLWHEQPIGVLSFDGAGWAEKLIQGGEKGAAGMVSISESVRAVVRGTDLAISSEAGCQAVVDGVLDAFTKSADFQAARASAGAAPLWGYVNVADLMKTLTAEDSPEAGKVAAVMSMIGLDTVPYGVLTVQGKGPEGAAVLTLKLAENQGGVLGLLPPVAAQMPALVPAGSSASLALNWGDAGAFLAGLRKLHVGPAGEQGPSVGEQLDAMTAASGINLDAFAAQLGSGAAVFLPAPGADGMISRADVTFVLHLKDAAGFRAGLETSIKSMGQGLVPATFDGTEMLQMMMPPAYMKFMDDRLVIGASPAAVNRYLKAQFPAAGSEPVGALVARLDAGLLMTSYPKPESGVKVYLTLLRDGRDLKLSVSYKDFTPASISRAYMAYPAIMAAMLMPALERARGEAKKMSGMSNMHQIGMAIMMYRDGHDYKHPPDLEALVDGGYLTDPTVFVDPADKNPQVRGKKGYRYSYEYPGPLPMGLEPSFILLASRKGVYPNGRNVVYADLSVQFVSEEDLHTDGGGRGYSLKQQYDWLMEDHGSEFTDEQKAAFRKFYEVEGTPAAVPAAAPAAPKPAQ